MGYHLETFKNQLACDNKETDSAPFPFLFRIYKKVGPLRSAEEAIKLVLEGFKMAQRGKSRKPGHRLTHDERWESSINFAWAGVEKEYTDDGNYNYDDYSETLKRIKEFYTKYPEGLIAFVDINNPKEWIVQNAVFVTGDAYITTDYRVGEGELEHPS